MTDRKDRTNYILYARVQPSVADPSNSLALQIDAVQTELANLGMTCVEIYSDVSGSTATVGERRGLTAALDAVASGTANALAVRYLDRIGRTYASVEETVKRLEENAATLFAGSRPVAGAGAGPLDWKFLIAMSAQESRILSERRWRAREK